MNLPVSTAFRIGTGKKLRVRAVTAGTRDDSEGDQRVYLPSSPLRSACERHLRAAVGPAYMLFLPSDSAPVGPRSILLAASIRDGLRGIPCRS
jgi:hypothetical protein